MSLVRQVSEPAYGVSCNSSDIDASSLHRQRFQVAWNLQSRTMSQKRAWGVAHAAENALAFDDQSQPSESLKPAHLAKRKLRNKSLEITFDPQEHRWLLCRLVTSIVTSIHWRALS